ncbi:MAG: TetR/AcrR family transcriptional regulator [Streptosporangiales bacterium]
MTDRRRGRRPDPGVDQSLRNALLGLFRERGVELTYDEVASRAGVGRATVFRRYPTKRDLVLGAATQLVLERVEARDTGSFRGDLRALVRSAMAALRVPQHRDVIRRFHGEACRDDAIAEVLRANLTGRLELFRAVTVRAIERGEVAAGADPAMLADLVSGLVALRLTTNTALPDGRQVDRLVDVLVDGFATR